MIINNDYTLELKNYSSVNFDLLRKFMGKTILITGAAGLIGTYLVDLLCSSNQIQENKINIIAVDRNDAEMKSRFGHISDPYFRYVVADIAVDTLVDADVDFMIHAASNTSPIDYANKPLDTIRCNVQGTDKLLQYAVKNKVKRFLFCSSVEAYGAASADVDRFSEAYSGFVDSNTLRAAYPSSKRLAETMCNAYNHEYGIDFCIARIGRIFGPTVIRDDAKAPTQFIMNAVNGEDILLKSDGMQLYSYGYVGDCAVAMLLILACGQCGEAYNISSEDLRLRDFAECCALNAGKELLFHEQNSLEKRGYSNITKAILNTEKLEALGFKPLLSVREAIDKTISYMKELY